MKVYKSFLFIGLIVLVISALTLLFFRKSSPQSPRQLEVLEKKERDTHPHPHDTQTSSTPQGKAIPSENPPTQETIAESKVTGMGLENAFQNALSLSEIDPGPRL